MTSHSRKWKESQVQLLQQLADKYPVIAVASLKNFPAPLAKELRKRLQGKAVIKVSKTRVFTKALKQSKTDTGALAKHVKGSVAVIFSEMNPFELYAFLKRNSVSMPAKAGVIAPDDIVVPAGDTGLPPGPALSDLKEAGLKTLIQGPTISIAEDKVVARKGETISAGVAAALSKLAIKPVKVSLKVVACFEKGQVFLANVLDIDAEKVKKDFGKAASDAFNLAVEVAYFTKETMPALIAKAFKNAKSLSIEAGILNNETIAPVLAKAINQANALKAKIPEKAEGLKGEAKAEEAKEEKPAGEKPEEKPAENGNEEKPAKEKPAEPNSAGEKKKE